MTHRLIQFATVAAVAAGLAVAQTPAARPRLGQGKVGLAQRGMIQRRVMKNLDLTDAQKEQAKTIFAQAREATKPIQEQLKQNREALMAARKANDGNQIRQLASQQGVLRGQVMAAQADAQAKFQQILTPEQRAKAEQMREKVRQRLQKRANAGRQNG